MYSYGGRIQARSRIPIFKKKKNNNNNKRVLKKILLYIYFMFI